MNCPSCGTPTPDGNRFCGNCGIPLDGQEQRIREYLERRLDEKVTAATASWKEQKLLDVETTEAIVGRIQSWAKVFGFFASVGLALLIGSLGILGYSGYAGLRKSIADGQAEVDKKLKDATGTVDSHIRPAISKAEQDVGSLADRNQELSNAQNRISEKQQEIGPELKTAADQVSALKVRAEDLSKRMDAASQLVDRVNGLSNRVDQIQTAQQASAAVDVRVAYEEINKELRDSAEADAAAIMNTVGRLRKILTAAGYSPAANASVQDLLSQFREAMAEAATDKTKLARLHSAVAQASLN